MITAHLTGHTLAPLALAAVWIICAALIVFGIITLARVLYVKLFDWAIGIVHETANERERDQWN